MADAGLEMRKERPDMGAVIGIDFDFEATNYHLRWQLSEAVKHWNIVHNLKLNDAQLEQWLTQLSKQTKSCPDPCGMANLVRLS